MKIVCDACQAKYSISDDKVQGKVFKIRCKKCSNIIVVRGGAGGAGAEPAPAPQEKDTRVYDYGYDGAGAPGGGAPADDAVWHLVINQDQVGPMTVGEVQQRFAAGEVDGETFAWREGFADWLPLAQVDAFAGLVASGSTTAALPSGGGGHQAVAAMFGSADDVGGTSRSDSGDLFAAASASSHHHQPDDDGGDLFGGGQRAKGGAVAASAAQQKMRGERNENSVLFSLNNLAQLASDKPAPAPTSSAGHATGAAGGEGSGLIDIRSMASAYLGGGGAAVAKPAGSGIGSIDDLPVFGGGGFSEPAVLVPTASRNNNNKLLYVMIGVVGLFAVAAVIMVVILLGNKPKTITVASQEGDKTGDTKPAADTKAEPSGSAAAAGPAAGSDTAPAAGSGSATQVAAATPPPAPTPAPAPAHPTPAPTPAPVHHHTESSSHFVAAATPPPSHHTDTPRPPDKGGDAAGGGGSCDEVSCVLNNYEGACCTKFKKGGHGGGGSSPPSGGGASNLPDALDKSMISGAIASVKGRVSSCGDKSSAKGVVKVHVKVTGGGGVSDVSVSQTPDPALGACVSAAVRRASFPKTQSGGSFSYPFVF